MHKKALALKKVFLLNEHDVWPSQLNANLIAI